MVVAQLAYNHLDPMVKARCDALIAVAKACHRGPAGAVDDLRAVGQMKINAFAANGCRRDGARTMQDAAAHDAGTYCR